MEEKTEKQLILEKTPRAYFTKTGNFRKDKLRPIILHDNRTKGSYYIGKNALKRDKRALKK